MKRVTSIAMWIAQMISYLIAGVLIAIMAPMAITYAYLMGRDSQRIKEQQNALMRPVDCGSHKEA